MNLRAHAALVSSSVYFAAALTIHATVGQPWQYWFVVAAGTAFLWAYWVESGSE